MQSAALFRRFLLALCVAIALVASPMLRAQSCGTPGSDGVGPISGTVNTYYPPTTATLSAGSSSVALGPGVSTSTPTAIAVGDMVLIIQMQDAVITTTNSGAYGDGVAGDPGSGYTSGTAGVYEFAIAASAVTTAGGTLTLTAGVTNTYTNAAYTAAGGGHGQKRYQVIRIPQYASPTLGSVTALAWNGTVGGVVAFDVAGTLNLGGGSIDAAAKGFRGGGGWLYSTGATGAYTDYVHAASTSTTGYGGAKGEGLAGTPRFVFDGGATVNTGVEGYPGGSMLRGAPGNAGGGASDGHPSGNDENAGGGGGANGGDGGHGGNSWNSNLAAGGFGGNNFVAATAKIVLGGGGGAGSTNNSTGYRSSGGAGGGIVILRVGAVTGSGSIIADGDDGQSPDQDGGGGGGAGGSVVVFAKSGTLAGLAISAKGGNGGDTWVTQTGSVNAHGPGGGGGGGWVLQSGGASVSVTGGAHGVTTTGSLQYNAINGDAGQTGTAAAAGFTGATQGAACFPVLTVTKSTTTPTVAPGGSATYKITVKNTGGLGAATGVTISDLLPQPIANGFTFTSTSSATPTGSALRLTTSNPAANATNPAWGTWWIPANGQVDITFVVKIAATVPMNVYQNPATASYLDPARSSANTTASFSYDPASSTAEDVWVRIMLSGFVFVDANHDGNRDTSEDWSGGTSVYVNLVQGATIVQSVNVPAGGGAFSFNTASVGSYTVVLTTSAASTTPTAPAGWLVTMPSPASYSITMNSNPIVNLTFGLFNGTKVSGTVFQDDGSGSGTANNGAKDGGEVGLANVAVKITDTGTTTYDQTLTDSTGAYTLWLPAGATSVRVAETNVTGYLSTGASVGNSGGAYTRATDTIAFTNSGLVYAGLNFGEVLNATLAPNGALTALPNSAVYYPHSFVATTTAQLTFSVTDRPSPSTPGYSEIIYRDTNCNGQFESGEPLVSGAISVAAGTTVCIMVKSYVPPGAPFDANNAITLTAQYVLTNAAPALSLSYTATDVTTVGAPKNAGLSLEKAVDKATATSGTVITYTITYTNDSSGPLSSILINDATPAYTTFQSAACTAPLPSGITACSVTTQPAAGTAGNVQWTLTGSLTPTQGGTVTFSVKVN
jgi:uncharacterized repeat protein (TIGR01451 family)